MNSPGGKHVDWQGAFVALRGALHRKRVHRWLPRYSGWWGCWYDGFRHRVEWRPRRGIFVSERIGRADQSAGILPPLKQWEWPEMKKRIPKDAMGDAKHRAPMESAYFSEFMSLLEHMAMLKYDDGSKREVGWITITTRGDAWVVTVKDPDGACELRVIAATLDKALEDAAMLVSADDCPWVEDPFLRAKKAKTRKS